MIFLLNLSGNYCKFGLSPFTKLVLFLILISCVCKKLYVIFNNTFENFKQIIKRHKGGNTRQSVLQTFYSLKEDKIRCSSFERIMERN